MKQQAILLHTCFLICSVSYATNQYSVYEPNIVKVSVYDAKNGILKYNHCPSIGFFKDNYFATWNANIVNAEGKGGQKIYYAKSRDGLSWGSPVPLCKWHSDQDTVQWQPNFFNYQNKQLWCLWSKAKYAVGGSSGSMMLSTLDDPNGNWQTRVLYDHIIIDGKRYFLFAQQNPTMLASGRIVVAYIASIDPNEAQGLELWSSKKYAVFFYTDDEGKTWNWSRDALVTDNGLTESGKGSTIWEPMLVQQSDGNVRMFARLNVIDRNKPHFITALGNNDATKFETPSISSFMTVSSRMWVGQLGNRRIMLHHDSSPTIFLNDRINISLLSSRTGEDDFVAGTPIIDDETVVGYPQGLVHDKKLYVVYSQGKANGNLPRSIRLAIVEPVPSDNSFFIFPRSERRALTVNDGQLTSLNLFRFDKGKFVEPKAKINFKTPLTISTVLRVTRGGQFELLNSSLSKTCIRINEQRNVEIRIHDQVLKSNLQIPYGQWTYLSILIDWLNGNAKIYSRGSIADNLKFKPVDDQGIEKFAIRMPDTAKCDTLENDIFADLHQLAIYNRLLSIEQLNFLENNFYNAPHDYSANANLGFILPSPSYYLIAADPNHVNQYEITSNSPNFSSGGEIYPKRPVSAPVVHMKQNGEDLLLFQGNSSAGLDIPPFKPGEKLVLNFRMLLERKPISSQMSFVSIGGEDPIILGYTSSVPGYLSVRVDGRWSKFMPFEPGTWVQVKIVFNGSEIQLSSGTNSDVFNCKPTKSRFYLGDGYPTALIYPADRFVIDVNSINTAIHKE